MSLLDRYLGKWMDESCKRTALIVCQKKQELNISLLVNSIEMIEKQVEEQKLITENQKNAIENQNKLIEAQDKIFDSIMANSIPIGFLYTQFPNQTKPEDLWPNTKWS